jgi:hypothetical protein
MIRSNQCQVVTVLMTLVLVVSCNSRKQPSSTSPISVKYESDIEFYLDGTPQDKVTAAADRLQAAGIDAFPALVAHLRDHRPAAGTPFAHERAGQDDVGIACYDLIEYQLEGWWFKMYRGYEVLHPDNTGRWLEAHQGMTLTQLRAAVRAEEQKLVRADLAANPGDEKLAWFANDFLSRTYDEAHDQHDDRPPRRRAATTQD